MCWISCRAPRQSASYWMQKGSHITKLRRPCKIRSQQYVAGYFGPGKHSSGFILDLIRKENDEGKWHRSIQQECASLPTQRTMRPFYERAGVAGGRWST